MAMTDDELLEAAGVSNTTKKTKRSKGCNIVFLDSFLTLENCRLANTFFAS